MIDAPKTTITTIGQLFGLTAQELAERQARGVKSALYQRLVRNVWPDDQPGLIDLPPKCEVQLNQLLFDIVKAGIKEIDDLDGCIAVIGSYLLDGHIPSLIIPKWGWDGPPWHLTDGGLITLCGLCTKNPTLRFPKSEPTQEYVKHAGYGGSKYHPHCEECVQVKRGSG